MRWSVAVAAALSGFWTLLCGAGAYMSSTGLIESALLAQALVPAVASFIFTWRSGGSTRSRVVGFSLAGVPAILLVVQAGLQGFP